MKLFNNSKKQLQDIGWVAVFFLVLGILTFPVILAAKEYGWEITMLHQAVIVVIANWIGQRLRKRPMHELTGKMNATWVKNFVRGLGIGFVMMILPAGFLYAGGWVGWQITPMPWDSFFQATGLFLCVAVAEEFLFRGYLFQRLGSGFGFAAAQLAMSGYFVLTHSSNPGMEGEARALASLNIFVASLVFGLAFIRTKSLAMPLAIHFMANFIQGTVLGFGVSGDEQAGLLKPVFGEAPSILTGGHFGLEASIPGLVCVVMVMILLYRWNPAPGPG